MNTSDNYEIEIPEDLGVVSPEDENKGIPYSEICFDKERFLEAQKEMNAKLEEHNKRISTFIFDEKEILENKIFPVSKINNELYSFGVFLPRNKDEYDDDGKYLRTKQIQVPVLITSDKSIFGRIIELNDGISQRFKIQILNVPNSADYPKRMELSAIKEYIENPNVYADGREIFETIVGEYKKYVYFAEKEWYLIHALWDIGTYFFILFKYYPIMELRGLKGSGKTKVMTLSRQFTFNASEELTNPSEAALFRDTDEKRCTKYVDEAEKLFSISKGQVQADSRAECLNSSYKYTGSVPRVEKVGTKFVTKIYHTYSPTMICSINGLYGATENRAIVHVMIKNPSNDTRGNTELYEDNSLYEKTRNNLYLFALQNWKEIEHIYDSYVNDDLQNRDFWIFKPLLVIAKYIDEDLHREVLDFLIKLAEVKKVDYIGEGSSEYKILVALKSLIGQRVILVKDVASALPIDEYQLSNRTIARIIDNFGFRDHKTHSREGNGYEINPELFYSILSGICPQLIDNASLYSQSSQSVDNKHKSSEDTVKISEESML